MSEEHDIQRLRNEYADRAVRLHSSDIYSPFNPAHLFAVQSRQRVVLRMLRRAGFYPLTDKAILEIGCGGGEKLHEFLGYGVTPASLHGSDLLLDRVQAAHARLPHLPLTCADAQRLPYASASFDLVMQYTVLSSVLDDAVKQHIAAEMRRVVKPEGLILWYDFWLNPTNPQTKGIKPAEIRQLFPGCHFAFHRITLAPPIARRLVPVSWLVASLLEKLRIFNTHYLVAIRPA